MGRPRKRWSHTEGKRPYTVRVYERSPGGPIWWRIWDPETGDWHRESLGHKDKHAAVAFAARMHAKLVAGEESMRNGRTTLGLILDAYQRHRSPIKSARVQVEDRQQATFWRTVLGEDRDPFTITPREWSGILADVASGALNARGRRVPTKKRRTVRARAVERRARWLVSVFRWATAWRTESGFLLSENPLRGGFDIPREKNPRRPVATVERFKATLANAKQVHPYLRLALVLANETGHRIGAIRKLRRSDLHLDSRPGSITWPEDSDKQGLRWERIPITDRARAEIDRHLRECPVIGDGYLFPSARTPGQPYGPTAFNKWLKEAERLTGLEPLDGGLWHPYRRKFATEMDHQPDRIVAWLGGWKSPRTLDLYCQPSEGMLREALSHRKQLREAK